MLSSKQFIGLIFFLLGFIAITFNAIQLSIGEILPPFYFFVVVPPTLFMGLSIFFESKLGEYLQIITGFLVAITYISLYQEESTGTAILIGSILLSNQYKIIIKNGLKIFLLFYTVALNIFLLVLTSHVQGLITTILNFLFVYVISFLLIDSLNRLIILEIKHEKLEGKINE